LSIWKKENKGLWKSVILIIWWKHIVIDLIISGNCDEKE
jgi:hypothetical protein